MTKTNKTARHSKKTPPKHNKHKSKSRQGIICQKCGNKGNQKILMTKHHIYPLRDKPEEKLVIYLCAACHQEIENIIQREERVLGRRLTIDECNQLTIYFLAERDEKIKLPKKAGQLLNFLQHKHESFVRKIRKIQKDILISLDDANQAMLIDNPEISNGLNQQIDQLKELEETLDKIYKTGCVSK
jgi:hypothetical protein